MAMRRLTAIALLMLTGCVSVYGPTKAGNQPAEGTTGDASVPSAADDGSLIGNRNRMSCSRALWPFSARKG